MESTSANVHGQTSARQTVSTVDMPLKSDLRGHSFDSRIGSSHIECVFHLSSSIQPEEQQNMGSSSRLNIESHGSIDSASPGGQIRNIENDFPHISPQEQTGCSSSCVTWDEKAEIMEPKGKESDVDDSSDMLPTICDIETQERAPISIRNADKMDILLVDEESPKSISGVNQIDEFESETDNYMDALNTIDSDFEIDFDCQTKREVERYSNFTNEGTEDRGEKIHESELHPSNPESCTAFDSSLNQGMPLNSLNSVPSVHLVHEQPTLITGKSPHSESSPIIEESADFLDGPKMEFVVSNPTPPTSPIPDPQRQTEDKTRSRFCESQESSADVSSVRSVKFWTNGGLLGLEPSKPPDFSVSNAVNLASHPSTCSVMPTGDPRSGKLDISVENCVSIDKNQVSKCTSSQPGDQEDGVSIKKKSWGFSPVSIDTKPENLSDSLQSARFGHANGQGLNVAGPVTPRTELPVALDETISTEGNKDNNENSSRGFGLGHALLINGFRRNLSLVQDGKSEPASPAKSSAIDETSRCQTVPYQTFPETGFKQQFGHESPANSLSSSPPLEQMKISFHPINGFETSKLKLKFPDGSQSNESIRDMFPSFQLVPEPATLLHDIDFDSDDDTYCRSSPCMSDDCLSHHSESNSEQWESGETPINNDQELYDALCRISSIESASSSQEVEGVANGRIHVDSGLAENGAVASQSGLLLDLPSFDAVNPLLKQEVKHDSDPGDLVEVRYPKESMPPPPPLPPLQWCVSKSHLDPAEEKQHVISEALDHLFDLKILESTDSRHSEPVLARQQQNVEVCKPKSKLIEVIFSGFLLIRLNGVTWELPSC